MGQHIIPINPSLKNFEFFVTLDGDLYLLSFSWNVRDQAFYVSLGDSQGEPIAQGIKVVEDTFLFQYVFDSRKFPGDIMAFDSENFASPPKLGELGDSYKLIYFDQVELAII